MENTNEPCYRVSTFTKTIFKIREPGRRTDNKKMGTVQLTYLWVTVEWRNQHERVSGRGWCEDRVDGQTPWGWQLSVGTWETVTCRYCRGADSHLIDNMQPQGTFQKLLLLLWAPNSKENIPKRRHGVCQSVTAHLVDSVVEGWWEVRWSDGAWQSSVPHGCGILFSGWRKFYVAGEEHGLTFICQRLVCF